MAAGRPISARSSSTTAARTSWAPASRSLRDGARAQIGEPTELVVVDNASGDESCDRRRGGRAATPELLEMPENLGFPTAVSRGIHASTGDWVLLINNDVEVEPRRRGATAGRRPLAARDIGSVAAQMRFADDAGTINSAGIGVDRLGIAFDRLLGQPLAASETEPVEVFGACGGAALYRRAMLDEIGGFDESLFFALDDADVAWRAQMRGWRCLYAPARGRASPPRRDHRARLQPQVLPRGPQPGAHAGEERRHRAAAPARGPPWSATTSPTWPSPRSPTGRSRRCAAALKGLREWRSYRRAGAAAPPLELAPVKGFRAALLRRSRMARQLAAHRPARERVAPSRAELPSTQLSRPSGLVPSAHGFLATPKGGFLIFQSPRSARA